MTKPFNVDIIKKRWCGYCGEFQHGDWVEHLAHLTCCEKLLVRFLRKTDDKKK